MGLTFNLGRVSPSVFTDSSLNVGIGAAPSGSYKLEVTGTAKVSSTLLLGGALTGTSATFSSGGTSNAGFFTINDGTTTLGNSFAVVHRNANDGNGRFSLTRWQVQNTSGLEQSAFIGAQAVTGASNYSPNLILGVSTGVSTYSTYLTIVSTGAATFSSSVTASSSTTGTQVMANFAAANYGSPSSRTYIQIGTQYGDGRSRIGSINTTGNQSALVFQSHSATADVWNDAMYINGTGNVGIGATPLEKLWVNLATNVNFAIGGTTRTRILGVVNANDNFCDISLEGQIVSFYSAGAERMRITSGGDVGIGPSGTATSISRLVIAGKDSTSSNYSFISTNNLGGTIIAARNDGAVFFVGPYPFTTATAANMFLDSSGVIQRSVSSIKYKTDVQDYDKGLAELMKLRPVSYLSKSEIDSPKRYAGMIAEELFELGFTEYVNLDENGEPDSISYASMVTILTKAIQELNERLNKAGL